MREKLGNGIFGKSQEKPSKIERGAVEYVHKGPSHLKEGIPAIRACVGTREQFEQTRNLSDKITSFLKFLKKTEENVDFYGDLVDLSKKNIKHGQEESYANPRRIIKINFQIHS